MNQAKEVIVNVVVVEQQPEERKSCGCWYAFRRKKKGKKIGGRNTVSVSDVKEDEAHQLHVQLPKEGETVIKENVQEEIENELKETTAAEENVEDGIVKEEATEENDDSVQEDVCGGGRCHRDCCKGRTQETREKEVPCRDVGLMFGVMHAHGHDPDAPTEGGPASWGRAAPCSNTCSRSSWECV